jgi:hypothetical protein
MKTDDIFTGFEWKNRDEPAIIPKRLWDSMLYFDEATIVLASTVCGAMQGLIARAREGGPVDHAQLSTLDEMVSKWSEDLSEEKNKLYQLRSFLEWVPPADAGTTLN